MFCCCGVFCSRVFLVFLFLCLGGGVYLWWCLWCFLWWCLCGDGCIGNIFCDGVWWCFFWCWCFCCFYFVVVFFEVVFFVVMFLLWWCFFVVMFLWWCFLCDGVVVVMFL